MKGAIVCPLALPAVRRLSSIVVLLLAAVLAVVGCGGSKSSPGGKPAAAKPTENGGCRSVARPARKRNGGQTRPRTKLDPKKTYTVSVATNCGEFSFELDVKDSPDTSASFGSLARKGFFDGLTFHRIVPGFVIQGGDPTGTGTGGPGYKTVDPPPRGARYTRGVVAMAKAQNEPDGAAGSQFFVVTGADAGLPPQYAILGRVTKGIDVVERIGRLGDQSEQPTQTVVMQNVRVGES
jgi:peptidyl-prolyl cis-trans isomerase B (cyclophilin B)